MAARLVKPTRRKDRACPMFTQRVPKALRERVDGRSLVVPVGPELVRVRFSKGRELVRISLRTGVPSEIKLRQAQVAARLEEFWASLRTAEPVRLTHRQCVALVGETFRAWSDPDRGSFAGVESDTVRPGATFRVLNDPNLLPAELRAAAEKYAERREEPDLGELEADFGPNLSHGLMERGIAEVDPPTRAILLREYLAAVCDGLAVQARQAGGDYRPAPEADRFPEWETPKPARPPAHRPARGKVSLRGLADTWWAEAERAGRSRDTFERYRSIVDRLAAFLKHDDAAAVSPDDVLRYKDHRIAAGASLKTVKDGDLVGLKAVFGFAVANKLLPENPAAGIRVLRPKVARTREKGFTAEEAKAILHKATHHANPLEKPQTAAAKRWVPWLCAYTGARVGEVVQLRKEDVRRQGEWWTITITPEAGTVKTGLMRRVVLHPHLVEQGFPDFVKASRAGPLFVDVKADTDGRSTALALGHRLAAFAREVVPDERVKPNHGWRHLFRTIGREAGIADSVLDAVGGWATKSVGESYGDVSLAAQGRAFERFPRFDVA